MRNSTMRHLLRYAVDPGTEGGGADTAGDADAAATTADTANPDTDADGDGGEDNGDGENSKEADSPEEWDHARALAKIRKANAEAKAQRARAKAAEQKAATVDDLTRERDELARKVHRLEVAAEYGLDPRLAARLQGDTAEEMRQDAQELLEMFAPRTPPSQKPRTGDGAAPRQQVERTETSDEAAKRMFANRN
ncbi:hypothetical protein [Actinomyces procaprae]|uniref:hypothetical protein n=1 Tax=Actinomyces procaprae TaxID=2560010 RepID=UPI0010A263A9|nr:hypothetical protein [Actinomyces procaprae]